MKTIVKLYALVMLLVCSLPLLAESFNSIQTSQNWSVEASSARAAGIPIMLVFSSDHCSYCTRLHEEVLQPLQESGALKNRVLIREYDIEAGGKITDFDGDRVRSRIFVSRYDIYATPTVVLVDHLGRPLIDPIVGFNGADSYTKLLDEAINSAVMSLASLDPPSQIAIAQHQ